MLKLVSETRRLTPTILIIVILFLSFVGFSPVALVGVDESLVGTQNSDGDPLRQLGFSLSFALAALHVAVGSGAKSLLDVPIALVLLLVWCWLSLFWSATPDIAFRRVVLATEIVLGVAYCSHGLSFGAAIKILFGFMAVLLIADWLAVAIFPFAIHQPSEIESNLAGSWRGLHNHKNLAGGFCALCVIVFIYESHRLRSLFSGPLLIGLATGFLYMSRSKTSAGMLIVSMLIGGCAVWGYRTRLVGGIAAGCAVLLLLIIGVSPQLLDPVISLLDDPGSFTGRSQIWPVMIRYAADHPLLGSGYGSFWAVGEASPVFAYGSGWIRGIFEAHDGYLDVLAQLGSIGLGIVLLGLVIRPVCVLFGRPLAFGTSRWLLATMLSFCWLRDILESSIADRANPVWVVMVLMYCLLFRAETAFDVRRRRIPVLGWLDHARD